MAKLEPLVIRAKLQQGLVWDPRYGIALDGLLTSLIRASEASKGGVPAGSLLDGGLGLDEPRDWDLPLAKCQEGGSGQWHWLATVGLPLGYGGTSLPPAPFDAHRLMVKLDERRAEAIAISLPKNVGGSRGRFRTKLTPVLVTVAYEIQWHAIGDIEHIKEILMDADSIGGRRGSGEGKVESWQVQRTPRSDVFLFAHTHPNGKLGRAVPVACAKKMKLTNWHEGYAGLRPPMFHKARQQLLVLPEM